MYAAYWLCVSFLIRWQFGENWKSERGVEIWNCVRCCVFGLSYGCLHFILAVCLSVWILLCYFILLSLIFGLAVSNLLSFGWVFVFYHVYIFGGICIFSIFYYYTHTFYYSKLQSKARKSARIHDIPYLPTTTYY